jgi:hypothetical protein
MLCQRPARPVPTASGSGLSVWLLRSHEHPVTTGLGEHLQLSDVGATVPSWSCRTRAPPGRAGAVRHGRLGPSWSPSRWRASGRAGAVRRARHGAELEVSDAGATVPSWSCRTRAPRAELELSTRAPRCRTGAVRRGRHGAEVELSDARPSGPSWSCPNGRHAPRAGHSDGRCPRARPGPAVAPTMAPRCHSRRRSERRRAANSAAVLKGAVPQGRHVARAGRGNGRRPGVPRG